MNGVSPDPSQPAREPDAVARLQLTQALQRAQYAIAWERAWPGLARLLSVIGLFLVVSWAGLWLALPFVARAAGIVLFVCWRWGRCFHLRVFAGRPAKRRLSRLDRGTGIRHRPATALTDTLASKDPIAQALWREQRERTLASIKRIRAGLPSPRLAYPRSLRAARAGHGDGGGGLCRGRRRAQDADCGGVRLERRAGARQCAGRRLGDAAGSSGKPPVILSAANRDAASPIAGRCRFPPAAR